MFALVSKDGKMKVNSLVNGCVIYSLLKQAESAWERLEARDKEVYHPVQVDVARDILGRMNK